MEILSVFAKIQSHRRRAIFVVRLQNQLRKVFHVLQCHVRTTCDDADGSDTVLARVTALMLVTKLRRHWKERTAELTKQELEAAADADKQKLREKQRLAMAAEEVRRQRQFEQKRVAMELQQEKRRVVREAQERKEEQERVREQQREEAAEKRRQEASMLMLQVGMA